MPDPDPGTPAGCPEPDLAAARKAVDLAKSVVDAAAGRLARAAANAKDKLDEVDEEQVVAYDMAHAAAAVRTAEAAIAYGDSGGTEACLACAFTADMMAELAARTFGREAQWGAATDWMSPAADFVEAWRAPAALAALAGHEGRRMLDPDFDLVRETFRRFSEIGVRPNAEHVHRTNGDIPEEIIAGLGELGGFGLSVPEEYGGYATGSESDYLGMVIATEELSWGSLGIGGSLITRPEILCRALVHGGTEAQKQRVAAEARFGRGDGRSRGHRARLRLGRRERRDVGIQDSGRMADKRRQDVVHVRGACRGADASCEDRPDRSKAHRGLSLFVVPKERADGKGFALTQEPASDRPARAHGGTSDRHSRVPGDALVRGRTRELVRSC